MVKNEITVEGLLAIIGDKEVSLLLLQARYEKVLARLAQLEPPDPDVVK